MSDDQPRTDAPSRERSPDHEFTLSVEQVADLYAEAGLPRTLRSIQKYCAVRTLDGRRTETETGQRWLVAPYSVERHIAYIKEVRPAANERVQPRTDAIVRFKGKGAEGHDAKSPEQSRTDATIRLAEERYIVRLESEAEFLRGQVGTKDKTIEALLERDRETNILIAGLQKMLGLPGSDVKDRG